MIPSYHECNVLTGATGYFAKNYMELNGNVTFVPFSSNKALIESTGIDYLNDEVHEIANKLKKYEVHTLIHAAGIRPKKISSYSDSDIRTINVELTKKMVKLCKILQTKILYISSDSVYENSNERNENSTRLDPITKYARSKLESELIIQESGINHTIARTSFFGGLHIDKDNYLNKAHNNVLKGELITASTNHYTSPIGLKSLIYFLKNLENIGFTGIVNIGCTNVTSQYDKVKLIWKSLEKEIKGKNLNLVDDLFQLDLQMDMGKLLSIFKMVDISFVKEVESEFMKTKDS